MSEMDPSAAGTNRLRRRSFFEVDAEPTTAVIDNAQDGSVSEAEDVVDGTEENDTHTREHQSFVDEVVLRLHRFQTWFVVHWQSMQVYLRWTPVRRYHALSESSGPMADTTTAAGVTMASGRVWTYPTEFLTLGSLSLLLLQFIIFWNYQVEPFHLNVQECSYQAHMSAISNDHGTTMAPIIRYLSQRFEQQQAAMMQENDVRKPTDPDWTCMKIFPANSTGADMHAKALLTVLPGGQMESEHATTTSSRLQLFVSSRKPTVFSELKKKALTSWMVLSMASVTDDDFARDSPDLVIVQTDFALRQIIRIRSTIREAQAFHNKDPADKKKKAVMAGRRGDFGIYYTKSSVPDIYERTVRKDWNAFLHVVAKPADAAGDQFTREILDLWIQNPTWPKLYIRYQAAHELCTSFSRFVSIKDSARSGEHPRNIDINCDDEANSPSAIRMMKNSIAIHLFPAPAHNGAFNPLVLESQAAGAIVMTFDSPVMQEFLSESGGIRVGSFTLQGSNAIEPSQGINAIEFDRAIVEVEPQDIEEGIKSVISMPHVARVAAGRAARQHYLKLNAHYSSAMAALDSVMCEFDRVDEKSQYTRDIGARDQRRPKIEALRAFLH